MKYLLSMFTRFMHKMKSILLARDFDFEGLDYESAIMFDIYGEEDEEEVRFT